ncbi:hypothetical protein C8R44DRAFT_745081 [Mycena epipterygia]|nr:hypothetical protein C8R44DRAFT_745081 [Mycena epipterygia]
MWRAAESPTNVNIVGLDDTYFSDNMRRKLRLGVEPCGCERTGLGCAVCGNPLGALHKPCESHMVSKHGYYYYILLPSAVSPPIPSCLPPGPSVWRAPSPRSPVSYPPPPHLTRPRHPTSPPPQIIYAFFTPTPSPEFLAAPLPSDELEGPPRIRVEGRRNQRWCILHRRGKLTIVHFCVRVASRYFLGVQSKGRFEQRPHRLPNLADTHQMDDLSGKHTFGSASSVDPEPQ